MSEPQVRPNPIMGLYDGPLWEYVNNGNCVCNVAPIAASSATRPALIVPSVFLKIVNGHVLAAGPKYLRGACFIASTFPRSRSRLRWC